MKKRILTVLLAGSLIVSLGACKGNQDAEAKTGEEKDPKQSEMEDKSKEDEFKEDKSKSNESAEDNTNIEDGNDSAGINALIEEENNLFMEHEKLWDKVFDNMDKDEMQKEMDNGKKYAQILKEQIEKISDKLSEEEKETLQKDANRVEEIEDKIDELSKTE